MLIFCGFIQVCVFTTNHHLKVVPIFIIITVTAEILIFVSISELQIRGDIEDHSKIMFLISQRKHTL